MLAQGWSLSDEEKKHEASGEPHQKDNIKERGAVSQLVNLACLNRCSGASSTCSHTPTLSDQ